MEDKKITPSDLRAEAQRLVATGKMPELEDLLQSVASVREKYKPIIEKENDNGNDTK
jgi:hypothetical protein